MPSKAHIPLAHVQQWMQYLLLSQGNTLPGDQQQLIPADEGLQLEDIVKNSKRLSARQHLAIYQRSYTARLRDCMSKQFGALEYALGEDLFCAFADEYLLCHPSTHYNLITLGEQFPAWLEANRPDKNEAVKEDWPDFMIELARFEYAINIIFEEEAEENIELATASAPDEALQLIPVFHVFEFKYPIRWYYHAFANKLEPELPLPDQTYCAVLRHQFTLSMHDLNQGQYLLLQYLLQGYTIPQARVKLLHQYAANAEQFDAYWPLWKKNWLDAGFFRSR